MQVVATVHRITKWLILFAKAILRLMGVDARHPAPCTAAPAPLVRLALPVQPPLQDATTPTLATALVVYPIKTIFALARPV